MPAVERYGSANRPTGYMHGRPYYMHGRRIPAHAETGPLDWAASVASRCEGLERATGPAYGRAKSHIREMEPLPYGRPRAEAKHVL